MSKKTVITKWQKRGGVAKITQKPAQYCQFLLTRYMYIGI